MTNEQKRNAAFRVFAEVRIACEAYDRAVCTGCVRNGDVLPATPEERELCVRFAADRNSSARRLLQLLDVDEETAQAARAEVSGYRWSLLFHVMDLPTPFWAREGDLTATQWREWRAQHGLE